MLTLKKEVYYLSSFLQLLWFFVIVLFLFLAILFTWQGNNVFLFLNIFIMISFLITIKRFAHRLSQKCFYLKRNDCFWYLNGLQAPVADIRVTGKEIVFQVGAKDFIYNLPSVNYAENIKRDLGF
ncbi:MAG: hypothetical protein CME71_06835 [Halobacteriovorax sp.]|nr:hypothetical protein [Halobacteriovorax sp.]|tara:strand:- start:3055 stop:3429 length:375 start_codon:yes stop_codon:yes gene_type:complete